MKKTMILIFAATLLLTTFSCKDKKTCKECGWYNESNNELVETVGQKCDGDIDAFLITPAKSVSTTTVKTATKQVPKCN